MLLFFLVLFYAKEFVLEVTLQQMSIVFLKNTFPHVQEQLNICTQSCILVMTIQLVKTSTLYTSQAPCKKKRISSLSSIF